MSNGPKRATCPLCVKVVPTFWWNNKRIFVGHYVGNTRAALLCDGTGWLVEDDELIERPRKVRSDAGRAH